MKIAGAALVLIVCLSSASAQIAAPADSPQAHPGEHHHFFSPPLSMANDARPMRAGDKFKLFALNTVNPFQIVSTAAWAGIEQADDRFPSWGQGAEGYGKRFAAAYVDTASSNFFGTFLYPSLLKQDPRYFRKQTGSFGARLGYALSRIIVTRTDHGTSAPNASLWMGAVSAGALSNAYYPTQDQGVALTFQRAGYSIVTNAGFNIAREFWPDISSRLFHKKR